MQENYTTYELMKNVVFGTIKRKNHKGVNYLIRRILRKDVNYWYVNWYSSKLKVVNNLKINDSFDGKKVGFLILKNKKKKVANVVTFYPENFMAVYKN